ncbi:MAG: ubiquinone/menaquinone biosynthesis methyltransferase [Thermodesulfobacteria bacterium]|nr:ubiquinone/menaquinone biosynthesis methyltransferase [Thermodesulfobacteriota bacterium]
MEKENKNRSVSVPIEEKKDFVHEKFSAVTAKYDFLNSLLSLGIDRLWRYKTVKTLRDTQGPILDICAGTLPLSREVFRQTRLHVIALDFCFDMLRYGLSRLSRQEAKFIHCVCGDGENLPLPSQTFGGFTVAFGIRNLADLEKGFSEMYRVLRPGGKGAILEFSRPSIPVFKQIYRFYLHRILPRIGGLISGDKEAYVYLAESIQGFFSQEEVCTMLKKSGFVDVTYRPMTFGIVTLYCCKRPG